MNFDTEAIELMHEAPKLFGRMLDQLMLASMLSQHQLAKEATAERRALIDAGKIISGDPLIGGMTQQTVSNVVTGQRPTFGQVLIWLEIIKRWYRSPKMREKVSKAGLEEPRPFTAELEKNMWRLALFGTKEEIKAAYEKYKDVDLLEDRPVIPSHRTLNLPTFKNRQDTDTLRPASQAGPNTDQIPRYSPVRKQAEPQP